VRLGPRENSQKQKKYSDQQQRKMDCGACLMPNKKSSPSSGQNGQLVHWWLQLTLARHVHDCVLVHIGHKSRIDF
jgi:hypothetical protein